MDEKILTFLKKPPVIRSIYFIGCMIISFSMGVFVHAHIVNSSDQPTIIIPKQPVPMSYRYKDIKIENPYDIIPALNVLDGEMSQLELTSEQKGVITTISQPEKRFIASKTGTKYYPLDCGTANRIKEENKIFFATEQEAQEKGFERTETCK